MEQGELPQKNPAPPKEYRMTKEEKLKERIEGYEEEKKRIDAKIRKIKSELKWMKIKKLTQKKDRMNNDNQRRGWGKLRWN